ncbi:MAG TPA: RluA family pseudouridine synthase [Bacteroidales bacterium]|nr:RluA family pseudouridine synthase [Bacteroidales bacterium]
MQEDFIERDDELQEDNAELYEHFRFVVDKGQSLIRIDKYLQNRIENASRNRIQQAAKAGNILVNGQRVKQNYRVKPSDVITVVFSFPPREVEIIPQHIPLNIVYEDDDLIVINKQAGLVVHPGHGNYSGTLLNALAWHFSRNGSKVENGFGYLVHRIDKDTTGLMIVAKDEIAQAVLARQFFEHTIYRRYQALVWGEPKPHEGTIIGHIGRSLRDRLRMDVFADGSHGKEAITHYKLLRTYGYVSLVECRLETGRTHQIRAHMRYLGHPLFNDARYGGDNILKGTTFNKYKQFISNCFGIMPRHALHAISLGFTHPKNGQYLQFDSSLPDDFSGLLNRWENYLGHRPEFHEFSPEDHDL